MRGARISDHLSAPRRTLLLLLFLQCLAWPLLASAPARADSQSDYNHAVSQAQAHAQDPAGWTVGDLGVITGNPATDGNTYVGGLVLVRTFTKDSYYRTATPGTASTVYGAPATSAMWVTTGSEYKDYLAASGSTAATVHDDTARALGMNTTTANNAIFELLASPDINTILRPVKDPAIDAQPTQFGVPGSFVQPAGMTAATYANFQAYYNNWAAQAYSSSPFPWTQLGYTYVWGQGDSLPDIRGLSEYILLGGTAYTAYSLYSVQSYLYTAGNGSGDFNVTGTLDTLWAGRAIQAHGDHVTIAPGAVVSGGQGLLLTSLGYTLTNSGEISGSTSVKFGIAGTENVAVLFQGSTFVNPYDATLPGATSRLVNSGTIQSPGTAVRVDAGDFDLTSSGTIAGGSYALQTGAGADTVTISSGRVQGVIDLGAGADSMSTTGASTLAFSLDPATPQAPIRNVETLALDNATVLSLNVTDSAPVASGQAFDIARTTSLTAAPASLAVTSNLPMITWTARTDPLDANALQVLASRDGSWYADHSSSPSLGRVLDGLAGSSDPSLSGLVASLDASGDPAGNSGRLAPFNQAGGMATALSGGSAYAATFSGRMQRQRGATGGAGGLAPLGFSSQEMGPAETGAALDALFQDREPALQQWRGALPASPRSRALLADMGLDVFADLYGHSGSAQGSGGAPGYDTEGYGLLLGLGRSLGENVRAGLALGYAQDETFYDGNAGRSREDIWRAGPYVSMDFDPWTADLLLSYGHHEVDAWREVSFLPATARASYVMHDVLAYLSVSRAFDLDAGMRLAPYLEMQYFRLWQESYQESGAGAADLDVRGNQSDSLEGLLGLRLSRTWELESCRLTPAVWGGWLHEYLNPDGSTVAAFSGSPGQTFSSANSTMERDKARLGAGLESLSDNGLGSSLRLDGTLAGRSTDLSLTLGLSQSF